MEQDYLLSREVLQEYFKDLSNILVDIKDDQMELTDRFIVEPIEVWVPSDHDFFLIKNQVSSLKDDSKVTINTIMRRSKLNQEILYQLSFYEIEQRIKKEFSELLFQMNYLQERYGDFYFISKLVPSLSKIISNRKSFPEKIDNLLNDKLLPKIADQYITDNDEIKNFSVKISDPEFSLSNDPLHKESFLYLMIDLLNREMETVNEFNVSLDFEYLDYDKFLWIYEDQDVDIDTNHLSYTEEINQAIKRLVNNKQILRYDNISLLLVDYNGLSSKNSFVADGIETDNNQIIDLFMNLVERNELSDFIVSVEPLNESGTILKAIVHSELDDDFAMFIGPGGLSTSYGPLYSSEHKIQKHSSLRSAANELQTLIGYKTDQVPMMMAIFDKRRTNKLLEKGQNQQRNVSKFIENKEGVH